MSGGQDDAGGAQPPKEQAGPGAAGFKVLQEGSAQILLRGNDVFYNKAQVINRDLSIAVLRAFQQVRAEEAKAGGTRRGKGPLAPSTEGRTQGTGTVTGTDGSGASEGKGEAGEPSGAAGEAGEAAPAGGKEAEQGRDGSSGGSGSSSRPSSARPLRILEGLAASGLRALRYACEVPDVGEVVALDKDPVAVEACRRNIEHNHARFQAEQPAAPAAEGQQGHEGQGTEKSMSQRLSAVRAEEGDARLYMLQHEKMFDAVDLDPYGTPSQFLDSAVQSVADGGLLLCTATDMAVLCGNNAEVCYSKYGCYPHRAKYCHEMALRMLLACIESHANRYKRHIVPVLSVSVDFYIRVFVRIYTSAGAVKASPSKLASVYQCCGCDSFHLQRVGRIVPARSRNNKQKGKGGEEAPPSANGAEAAPDAPDSAQGGRESLTPAAAAAVIASGGQVRYLPGVGPSVGQECADCGKRFAVGGPIWAEPLHDMGWVRSRMLPELERNKAHYPAYAKVHGLLTTVSEELEDVPLFVDLHSMSAVLKCTPPAFVLFKSAVLNQGFRVSSTHASPLGLKTDAPMPMLWDIMRQWVKRHPVKTPSPGSPAEAILAKEPSFEVNFSKAKGAQSKAQLQGVPRFLPNPEGHWGPKPKARRREGVDPKYSEPADGGGGSLGEDAAGKEDEGVGKGRAAEDDDGLCPPESKRARTDVTAE